MKKGKRSRALLAYHSTAFLFQDPLPVYCIFYLLWFEKAQLGRCWHSCPQRILPLPTLPHSASLGQACVWDHRPASGC